MVIALRDHDTTMAFCHSRLARHVTRQRATRRGYVTFSLRMQHRLLSFSDITEFVRMRKYDQRYVAILPTSDFHSFSSRYAFDHTYHVYSGL